MKADLIAELELLHRVADKAAELADNHGHKKTAHFLRGLGDITRRILDELR